MLAAMVVAVFSAQGPLGFALLALRDVASSCAGEEKSGERGGDDDDCHCPLGCHCSTHCAHAGPDSVPLREGLDVTSVTPPLVEIVFVRSLEMVTSEHRQSPIHIPRPIA